MDLLNIPPAGSIVCAKVSPTPQGDVIKLYYHNGDTDINICSISTDPFEMAAACGAIFLQARAAGYKDCQADLRKGLGL